MQQAKEICWYILMLLFLIAPEVSEGKQIPGTQVLSGVSAEPADINVAPCCTPEPDTLLLPCCTDPAKVAYGLNGRLSREKIPERVFKDGFAIVVLRDAADSRNLLVCKELQSRLDLSAQPTAFQYSRGYLFHLRPIYWPLSSHSDVDAKNASCDKITGQFDFVFGDEMAKVGKAGLGPFILIYKTEADYNESVYKYWSLLDFDSLTDWEVRENLQYLKVFLNRPSKVWPSRRFVGRGFRQRIEYLLSKVPIIGAILLSRGRET